jgi:DNA-binding Lrp family transcriptional regulator
MVEAYVLGKISPQREREAISRVSEIDQVKEVDLVYGKYDLIVRIVTDTLEELKNVVLTQIRKTEMVELTQTLVVTKAD